MDFYSVIMDFFWVSVILFVAKIIREHVKILQNFFIPVSLIALKTGYSNFSYFSQVFKKYTGMSPVEYRAAKRRSKL